MTTEKKAPALQTTIQPLVDSKSNPEKGTAGPNGESAKPVSPQAGEEAAESLESAGSPDGDTDGAGAEAKDDKAPVEEFEIFFDGEEEEKPTTEAENAAFFRMRKAEAEAARLKRELEAVRSPGGGPEDPGEEPTSEDCAFDEPELKRRLRKWDRDKAAFDAHKAKAAEQEQAVEREIVTRHNTYLAAGADMVQRGYKDYPEAEKTVAQGLDQSRKVALLKYANKPAVIVYYLGQNPEKLEELAKETDLGSFVAKLKDMEAHVKERKKNTTQAPPPEQSPRGSGAVNAGDTTLEKLRRKAQDTGDYGPVNDYKRKLKAQRGQKK